MDSADSRFSRLMSSLPSRFCLLPALLLWLCAGALAQVNPPPRQIEPAAISASEGWSCGDFPCEDDLAGFLERIQVAPGFELAHLGQFPGQPMQIAYGADGRLYGVILENGTRRGAVYSLVDGRMLRVSPRFWSPAGIAFDARGRLYVSGRLRHDGGGAVWRVRSALFAELITGNLPCCYSLTGQPNGMVFGADGGLYIGVGSSSDRAVPAHPQEAAILRLDVESGAVEVVATGVRSPYDLAYTADGQLYASDNGLTTGPGDRLLRIDEGGFYGFPYWGSRGCADCPPRDRRVEIQADWVTLPDYTLPRGMTVYQGAQFPANMRDTLFAAFWNGTADAQRIVWIDPADPLVAAAGYVPLPFATGFIRPVDVAAAPDGSLVVADFIYGHIWRISYPAADSPLPAATATPTAGDFSHIVFATATPRS